MTLKRMAYAGGSVILMLFAVSVLFLGNQRLAFAWELGEPLPDPETLAQEEICEIFSILEANGMSFPGFECEEEEEGDEEEDDNDIPMNQCQDGIDNDDDGATDWPDDEDCVNNGDNDEGDEGDSGGGGGGGEDETTPAEQCAIDGGTWNAEADGGRCEYVLTVIDIGPGVTNLTGTSTHATGTLVTLTPDPAEHATFSGFSQDCAGTEPCVLSIDGNTNVTATYACDEGYHENGASCEVNSSGGGEGGGSGEETTSSGGGGGGGGGNGPIVGAFGGGGGGLVLGAASAPSIPVPGGQCDKFLTGFIKPEGNNDRDQVFRLQLVLKMFEGAAIETTGTYDAATISAVHAFQTKYSSDILTPWRISKSTGYVYLTTRKKVNEIFCDRGMTFPLTDEEQAIVTAAKKAPEKEKASEVSSETPEPANRASRQETDEESEDVEEETTSETPVNSSWNSLRNFLRGLFNRGR